MSSGKTLRNGKKPLMKCNCGEDNPNNFYPYNKSTCKFCLIVRANVRYRALKARTVDPVTFKFNPYTPSLDLMYTKKLLAHAKRLDCWHDVIVCPDLLNKKFGKLVDKTILKWTHRYLYS